MEKLQEQKEMQKDTKKGRQDEERIVDSSAETVWRSTDDDNAAN